MTIAVFEASAVLALLFGETGADVVRGRIQGGLISTVNLAEVLAKLVDKGLPTAEAARAVDMLGMEAVLLSSELAQMSAALRPVTRAAGLRSFMSRAGSLRNLPKHPGWHRKTA